MKSGNTPNRPSPRRQSDPYRTYLARRYRAEPEAFAGNEEPALNEVLADPMVVAVMESDNVPHHRLTGLIQRARRRIDES